MVFQKGNTFALGKIREKSPGWKGDYKNIKYRQLHSRVRRLKPKPKSCEMCHEVKSWIELTNVSPTYNPDTYNEDLNNWRWMCRKCHIESDGRLKFLDKGRIPKNTPDMRCGICNGETYIRVRVNSIRPFWRFINGTRVCSKCYLRDYRLHKI